MEIRRVAENVDNFEGSGLLAGDPIRVDRIYNGKIAGLAELTHESQCVVKIAIDRDDLSSVSKSLKQFSRRNFSRRQNHDA